MWFGFDHDSYLYPTFSKKSLGSEYEIEVNEKFTLLSMSDEEVYVYASSDDEKKFYQDINDSVFKESCCLDRNTGEVQKGYETIDRKKLIEIVQRESLDKDSTQGFIFIENGSITACDASLDIY